MKAMRFTQPKVGISESGQNIQARFVDNGHSSDGNFKGGDLPPFNNLLVIAINMVCNSRLCIAVTKRLGHVLSH